MLPSKRHVSCCSQTMLDWWQHASTPHRHVPSCMSHFPIKLPGPSLKHPGFLRAPPSSESAARRVTSIITLKKISSTNSCRLNCYELNKATCFQCGNPRPGIMFLAFWQLWYQLKESTSTVLSNQPAQLLFHVKSTKSLLMQPNQT